MRAKVVAMVVLAGPDVLSLVKPATAMQSNQARDGGFAQN
jgi:hypothetical protein